MCAGQLLRTLNPKITLYRSPRALYSCFEMEGTRCFKMEGYKVSSIDALPTRVSLKDVVRYPPHTMPDVVITEIGLWEVGTDLGSIFSWSYWKSFISPVPEFTYNVILRQEAPAQAGGAKCAFILHETTDLEVSRTSFNQLRITIEPLVDDCTLMLTSGLLKEIILPKPIDPQQLSHHLTEVMATNPDAHPDWVKVMRALVLSAIGQDDDDGVDELFDKVDIHATDLHGNTLLHQAASAGSAKVWKRVTSKLMKRDSQKLMCTINEEGKNPVQMAFQKNFPDLVMAIMKTGIVLADYRDSDGCSPFHLAAEAGCERSIEAVSARGDRRNTLLSESSDNPEDGIIDALNSLNNEGFTPLMVAVQKGYVGSAVSLIQAGAEIDMPHFKTGDTALHIAAKLGLTSMVKTLIAFRADIYVKNKAGKTALDEAHESSKDHSERCVQALEETTQLMGAANAELSKPVKIEPLDPNCVVAMCIDGGGNKGILTCQVLIYLHERMMKIKPNCDPFHEHFDYLCGTSLGCLLILTMAYLKTSPKSTVSLFFKAASELFAKCPNCPKEIVDKSMQDTFGHNIMLSDVQAPRVIITTCRANENPPELELMCNYRKNPDRMWKTWETARASTAAPTYFPPHEDKYLDGGLVANNPTLDSMVEIFEQGKREEKEVKIGMVLSLGTGIVPKEKVDDIEIFIPESTKLLTSIQKMSSTVHGLKNVFGIMMSQSTRTDGTLIQQASWWCKTLGTRYFRFSPPLSEPVDLAVHDKEKLAELMYIGMHYTLQNAKQLDTVARLLLSRRK